jgi:hypothetical protein
MPRNTTLDGTPVQQAITFDRKDYNNARMTGFMLGVVMDVQLSDGGRNRIAKQFADQRGFIHTATVQVIDDGTPCNFPLPDVLITPDSRTGVNEYSENLPRATSCLTHGEDYNDHGHKIDPYALDGDMCVIGFLGGRLDSPFIARWWPHPKNTFDPATCGDGSPDIAGEGTTLCQTSRFFQRINGVETVITSRGDVYLSTAFSGSRIVPGGTPKLGRFPRDSVEQGGSVRLDIKPGRLLELNWNEKEDGIGVGNSSDEAIPQTNPPVDTPFSEIFNSSDPPPRTYLRFAEDKVKLLIPDEFRVRSENRTFIESQNETVITSGGITSIDSEGVLNLDSRAAINVVAEAVLLLQGLTLSLSAGGGLEEDEEAVAGKISLQEDGAVNLGPEKVPDVPEPSDAPEKQSLVTDGAGTLEANQVLVATAADLADAGITGLPAAPTPVEVRAALLLVNTTLQNINTLLQDLAQTEFTKAN